MDPTGIQRRRTSTRPVPMAQGGDSPVRKPARKPARKPVPQREPPEPGEIPIKDPPPGKTLPVPEPGTPPPMKGKP
jgi:hypothetical protein